MSKRLSVRASLLSGAAYLYAILPLAVPPILLLAATPAHADGGAGGSAGSTTVDGGAGGTGDNATAGSNGAGSGTTASGGGGGGAGGGAGGKGGNGNGSGGAGGTGGTSSSTSGGVGGIGTGGGAGGGGGGGFNASNVATITNPSLTIITGGAGGAGGNGTSGSISAGGGGGAGGYGVVITGSSPNSNAGTIIGGVGGAGGTGYGAAVTGGAGGDGGVGVNQVDGSSFTNTGTISGGAGGLPGAAGDSGASVGAAGLGGVGFEGFGVSLTNAGTISGGVDGGTTDHEDAIVFTGGTNTLTLDPTSVINGNVIAFSGNDTLVLGGSGSGTFDASTIGADLKYENFGSFVKDGTSTWTLTNVATQITNWTIDQGVLSVSEAGSLGFTGSVVTLNGGTLQFTQTLTDILPTTLLAGGGTIDTDGANTITLTGGISGTGGLTVTSSVATPGTLLLEGSNTYTGGTTIASGMTLQIGGVSGSTAIAGSISGNIADNGMLVFDDAVATSETGIISGTGSLTQEGTGVLTLSNLGNTYSGGTIVSAGLINFNGVGDFGSGATPNITLDGGGLQWATGTTTDISGDLKALAGNPANGGTTFDTNGNNVNFAHALTGTGGITKAGAGTLIFSVDNSYSGTTTVTGGLIRFKDAGAFGSAPSITLNGGGLQWATSYAGGDISADLGAIGTNGATFDTNGNTITLATALTGTGGVTVQDTIPSPGTPGMLILTAAETYGGPTTIASTGTLQLGNGTLAGALPTGGAVVDNGTLIFDLPSSATVTNPISGTGALTLTGTGAVTLDDAINLGGAVSLGNGLTVDASGNSSLTGVISGAGSLTMGGVGGILTLSNAGNTYSGGTTVTGGLINFSSAAVFGSKTEPNITLNGGGLQWAAHYAGGDISADLNAIGVDGAIFDTNGNNVTFGTALTDGGSGGGVTKQGAGTLTFTVANTYGGATTVTGGLIDFSSVSDFGSAPSIVLNGGGLQWAAHYAGGDISADLNAIGLNGAIFDTNGNDVTLGTALTGSGGITKTGAGTLTLGATEGYSGATTVSGGTLLVTGSLANSTQGVLVLSGGTFEGTGTIAGTGTAPGIGTIAALNVLSGGVAAPGVGATPGTLHVQGYADLQFGSELVINLTNTNHNSSQLAATGTALLAGQLVLAPAAGTYSLGESYTVVTAAGGTTGTFSGVTVDGSFDTSTTNAGNSVALTPVLSIMSTGGSADDAVITLDAGTISPFLPANAGTNQKNVALAIDHAMVDDGAVATFAPLTGATVNVNSALSDFTGEVGPATQSVELGQSESFLGTLQDAASVGVPSTGSRFASRYALQQFDDASAVGQGYVTPSYGNSGLDLWADVRAGQNQYDGSSSLGTHSTQATDYGGVFGFGFRAPSGRATFGIAMDYDDLDWSLSDALGRGRATAYQGGLYGSLLFGNAYVSAVGSFEEYNVTTNRTVVMPATLTTPATPYSYQAKFTTDGEGGHIEGGQRLPTGDGWITPYLGVTLEDIHTPAYSETPVVAPAPGTPSFALSYAKGTHTDISAELGAAYDSAFGSPRVDLFSFHMKLGWLHDFTTGLSDTATFEDFAGATFTVHGAPPSSDAAHLVLGIEQDYQGLALTLDAQGLAGTSGYSIGGNAGIAYRW